MTSRYARMRVESCVSCLDVGCVFNGVCLAFFLGFSSQEQGFDEAGDC